MVVKLMNYLRSYTKSRPLKRGFKLCRDSLYICILASTLLYTSTYSLSTFANPQGGQVSAGSAVISNPSSNVVQINQSSDKAVIDWHSYNISQHETVRYVQPSTKSIALNRINPAQGASVIAGQLQANGQIWLVNPAGILFTSTARVDAAGLLATTANISNEDFMAGNYRFVQDPNWNGAVINNGEITIRDEGIAMLVAPGVENNGVIRANLGKVVLASGTNYTVDFYGDQLIHFAADSEVKKPARDAEGRELAHAVSNTGKIYANGGTVLMTARAASGVLNNVINMSGIVEAKTAVQRGGSIILSGGDNGTVRVSGKMIASGKQYGQKGGKVKVLGKRVMLADKAEIDVSGDTAGGEVLVGGDYQGKNSAIKNAKYTYIGKDVVINADAVRSGNGGKVIQWADEGAWFYGNIVARGGIENGNGGFVETSGKNYLEAMGFVDARAFSGQAGQWLLDPANITISTAATLNGIFDGLNPNTFTTTANNAVANVATINASLNLGTSVTIKTTPGGTQAGTITLSAGVGNEIIKILGGTTTLTLEAADSITLNNSITSTLGALNVTLISGNALTINNTITTNGGNFLSTSQNATTLGNAGGTTPGIISTGAGTVTFNVNADGAGANAFLMNLNSSISTTNTTSSAVTINVNTSSGTGTGSATLRAITTGSGGTVSVNTNSGGDVLYGGAGTVNVGNGTVTLVTPKITGANIATSASPLQINAATLNATAGSTGIFITNAGTATLTIDTLQAANSSDVATGVAQVISSGAIAQGTNAVNVTTLTLKTLSDAGAAITFNNTANKATTINLQTRNVTDTANAAGAISYTDTDGFAVSGIETASTLSLTAGGSMTQTGALTVTGIPTFTVTAASSDILMNTAANSFTVTPLFTTSGTGTIRDLGLRNILASAVIPTLPSNLRNLTLIFDAAALNLPGTTLTGSLTATANGAITQTGTLTGTTLTAKTLNNTGAAITLGDVLSNEFTTINLQSRNAADSADASGAITYKDATGFDVSGLRTTSTASLTSNGNMTDSGALIIGDTLTLAAGANNITLNTGTNDFNTVAVTSSNNLTLVDANSLIMGASTIGNNMTLTTSGALTQGGVLTVSGTSTINAGAANNVTLDSFNNDFSNIAVTSGNVVKIKDINSVVLGTSGSVANPLGSLEVTAGGNITQNGILRVTGAATFTLITAATDISLANQANDFAITPTITNNANVRDLLLRNINTSAAVPTLPSLSTLRNVTFTFNNVAALTLPTINITGNLSVTTNGPITQSDIVTVPGTATFNATSNNITLTNASNDFGTVVITSGNNVAITDANALILGSSTIGGTYDVVTNGAITQSAAQSIAGLATFNANSNNITLATAGNNFSTIKILNGTNVSIRDTNSIILDDITASGTLTLQIGGTGNSITQANGKTISAGGIATIIATASNDVTLNNSTNDFSTVAITSANNVNLQDTNNLILGTSAVSGALSITTGGTITQSGPLTVTGIPTFSVTSANSDILLGTQANVFNTTPVFTNNGNIQDLSLRNIAATAAMPTLPTGLINLTLIFNNAAIDLPTINLMGTLTVTAGNAITQSGALTGTTLIAKTVNTSGANIALTNASNDFTTIDLRARNSGDTANAPGALSYQDANGFDVAAANTTSTINLIAGGAMTQSGSMAGSTLTAKTLNNLGSAITFTNSANSLAAIDLRTRNSTDSTNVAGDISYRDINAIDIANISTASIATIAATSITQSGPITADSLVAKTLNNAGGAITLNNANNEVNTVDLRSRNAADTANDTGTISYTDATGFDIATIATASASANALSLTANGAIIDSGTLTVSSGTTTINAGATNNITLDDAANDFNTVAITSSNNVTLVDASAIILGSSNISGNLTLTVNGSITDSAALSVTGSATFTAGLTNNVILNSAANDFNSVTIVSANDATIVDANNLTLTSANLTDDLTVTTTGTLTTGTITTNGGIVSLTTLSPDTSARLLTINGNITTNGAAITANAANPNNTTSLIVNGTLDTTGGSGQGTLTLSGGLQLNTAPILGSGNITLQGNGLDLTLNNLTFPYSVAIAVDRYLIIDGALTTIGANSNLTLTGDQANTGIGGVLIGSTGSINSAGNLILSGSSLNGLSGANTNAAIEIQSGASIVSDGAISLLGNVGNGNILVNSALQSNGNITITPAGSGVIQIGASSIMSNGGAMLFSSPVTLNNHLSLASSNGDITLNGLTGAYNLTLNSGSAGNILFNNTMNLNTLTVSNTYNLTNAGTINVTGYQQNAGSVTNFGTSTLNVNNGNASVTSNTILGKINIANGNMTANSTDFNTTLTVTNGGANINSTNTNSNITTTGTTFITGYSLFGTINVGELTLHVTGPMNVTGSVGGTRGSAAVAKINFLTPPTGLQFFNNVNLASARIISNAATNTQNVLPFFVPEINNASLVASSGLLISILNSGINIPPQFAGTSSRALTSSFALRALLPQQAKATIMSRNVIPYSLEASGTAALSPRVISIARGLMAPEAISLVYGLLAALAGLIAALSHAITKKTVRTKNMTYQFLSEFSFHIRTELNNILSAAGLIYQEKLFKLPTTQRNYFEEIMNSSNQMNYYVESLEKLKNINNDTLPKVSFNLRTFLEGITGFTEIIKSGKSGNIAPELKEFLNDIIASSHSILAIINDITARAEHVVTTKIRWPWQAESLPTTNLSTASFMLRTRLHNILGYAELIHKGTYGTPTEAQKEVLENMILSAQTMHDHLTGIDKITISNEFATKLSFNLRTALNGIITSAQLIHDNKMGDITLENKEYLEHILFDSKATLNYLKKLDKHIIDKNFKITKMDFY